MNGKSEVAYDQRASAIVSDLEAQTRVLTERSVAEIRDRIDALYRDVSEDGFGRPVRVPPLRLNPSRREINAALDAFDRQCRAGIHPTEGRTRDAHGEKCGYCGRRIRL